MRFAEIKGLEDIKVGFIDAVKKNHVAHAQLFFGREGSANLAMALAFATYLNCTDRQENDACGNCPSCKKMEKLIHPDMHFAFPVSATKNITGKDVISQNYLKEWRKFLIENPYGDIHDWNYTFGGENKQVNISKEESRQILKSLSLKAFEAEYKIMLIWRPEHMHPAAANAILKILEEPPEKTVFLLVSNDFDKLLTTILSRTQMIQIRSFSDEEIKNILIEEESLNESNAAHIAHLAEGNLNNARRMLGEVDDDGHKMFRDWMRHCYSRDYSQMVLGSDQFQKMNKESQKSLMQYGLSIMRETLISQFDHNELGRLEGEELDFVKNFGKVMDPAKTEKVVGQINTGYGHLERNANPKILFLDMSLSISNIIRS
ncbi:DNA polymerase III subunit delta [Fulvivirgaceae bacterium BMA10]|uniref:DNA polymerase III subunit delta n=1 Tax=Splendidivirga corallicola TaxID=3051826 RepID=A0ABT8L067_9BACT|nr:DNA polymerase III subunit delta [Fulvivirgaceae bacterium BMA10]